MRVIPVALLVAPLAGCDPNTMEGCRWGGGRVVGATGPPAKCAEDEREIGQIPYGIEGAVCCRKKWLGGS